MKKENVRTNYNSAQLFFQPCCGTYSRLPEGVSQPVIVKIKAHSAAINHFVMPVT